MDPKRFYHYVKFEKIFMNKVKLSKANKTQVGHLNLYGSVPNLVERDIHEEQRSLMVSHN